MSSRRTRTKLGLAPILTTVSANLLTFEDEMLTLHSQARSHCSSRTAVVVSRSCHQTTPSSTQLRSRTQSSSTPVTSSLDGQTMSLRVPSTESSSPLWQQTEGSTRHDTALLTSAIRTSTASSMLFPVLTTRPRRRSTTASTVAITSFSVLQ